MDWKPSDTRDKPLYKQIAEYIERRITYGEFPPGSLLPSERTLAKELQVNRSTIVAAYDLLRASGVIETRHGSGTRVSTDIWGISRTRVPNWRQIVETGSFLPNLPLIRQIRKETMEGDLIDLASGELSADLFPNRALRSILSSEEFDGHLGYEHPQGNVPLRETLSAHVKTWRDIDSTPSSILITSGAQQALHLIVQCLLKPGDAVAIEDPSYCYSLPLFQSAGLRTFLLPVDKYGANPDDLAALHRKHRIKMAFLNPNFQNPTGTLLDLSRRKRFLELSAEFGIPLVEDDPYSVTSFHGEKIPTLKSLDRNGTVLYISSLTKIVASGLRIGWIIGPQTVIERLADAKQQVDFGHSIFPQWIANRFLSSADFPEHIAMLREELRKKRDLLVSALHQCLPTEVEFTVPEGGIHLWCSVKQTDNESRLLKAAIKRGVVFVPGSVMGSKKGYARFTFGRAEKDSITDAIQRFSEALRDVIPS
ncbi:PLP-dependent aminotransferase family protein [Brevibacillus sp. H7]|jgi:GntR family transcriptional regulator of abcA and norABC|uniref:MocR-like pyridoxine biosynthesis transcription factor PdxR n=1 Tax=Brevibacillus sp. H7 TaxID=3349138 RepID=UPI003805610B